MAVHAEKADGARFLVAPPKSAVCSLDAYSCHLSNLIYNLITNKRHFRTKALFGIYLYICRLGFSPFRPFCVLENGTRKATAHFLMQHAMLEKGWMHSNKSDFLMDSAWEGLFSTPSCSVGRNKKEGTSSSEYIESLMCTVDFPTIFGRNLLNAD